MVGRWPLLVGLALALLAGAGGKRIPWWSIRIAQQQGPHACAVEEVPGTYMELWTECRYWIHRKICGQKTLIRYECCEGYQQLEEDNGCTAVKPLKNLLDTAEELGARRFVAAIRESGLAEELSKDGAFTLFAPTDSAFERTSPSLRQTLQDEGTRTAVLLHHLLDGKLTSKEMRADQLVPTRSSGAKIRLNRYGSQVTTANCHLLMRKDQKATNGIVHVINGVLDPSSISSASVVDLVVKDGRFSLLADAVRRSGLAEKLRRPESPVTLLAPSDEAFQKLPERQRQSILGDAAAVRALLENHVIPRPICKSAILDQHKMKSKAGNKLTFQCDGGSVFIERSEARNKEMLAEDGVVHLLDDVLIPDRAKSLLELAEQLQLDTFLSLVRTAGLQETLRDSGDFTLFVPSQDAFRDMPERLKEAVMSDAKVARRMLFFHSARGRLVSKDITDNQVVPSLDEQNSLRLQVHRSGLGVENAMVRRPDVQGRNGVLHVIDRVLQPVTRSAGDTLRQRGGFSMFLQAMEKVMMTNSSDLALHSQGGCTFFVPNDKAFNELGEGRMEAMMKNDEMLSQTMKNHISERMLPAASFEPKLTYHVTTKQGTVDVRKAGGRIMVGNARVLKRDILNTNGVIHVIDKVLLPPGFKEGNFKSRGGKLHRGSSSHIRHGSSFSRRVTSSSSSRSERRHRLRRPGGSSYTFRSESSRRVQTVTG